MKAFLEAGLFIFLGAILCDAPLQLLKEGSMPALSEQLLLMRAEPCDLLFEIENNIVELVDVEEALLELLVV